MDRILSAVTAEPDAGLRVIGVLYKEFVVRCRRGAWVHLLDLNACNIGE
jgi:hypothetical protein